MWTPHWFAGADGKTNQFWYRVNLPGGKSEYVTINAETGARQIAPHRDNAGDDSLPVLRAPHPSRDSAMDTEVTFDNRLSETVNLFWVDSGGGRVAYGNIPAGKKYVQHTFSGHVWLVTSLRSNDVAVFQAAEICPAWRSLTAVTPDAPRHHRRHATRLPPNRAP